jgi:hypothetical protein
LPIYLSPAEYDAVAAAVDRLVPGAAAAGVADYIDGFLGAFQQDPPRIWAGGPFSGRAGGEASFASWLALTPLDELAWRTRIEGSRGLPEREWNGPVVGLQERYRDGMARLGEDFVDLPGDTQEERLQADKRFRALLYQHACEGMYGAPEYGGNRDLAGWTAIGFDGDVLPRGYSDEEVTRP